MKVGRREYALGEDEDCIRMLLMCYTYTNKNAKKNLINIYAAAQRLYGCAEKCIQDVDVSLNI